MRTGVLPLPYTSQAIPRRRAGLNAGCVYAERGNFELTPRIWLPSKSSPEPGTNVPTRAENVVLPVTGSTAIWLAVGHCDVAGTAMLHALRYKRPAVAAV